MTEGVEQDRRTEASNRSVGVKRRALALGFDAVGITTLEPNAHAGELDRWLGAGYGGTMTYLHRQAEQRKAPARIWPEARAAVATLTNYWHGPADPVLTPCPPLAAPSLRSGPRLGAGSLRKCGEGGTASLLQQRLEVFARHVAVLQADHAVPCGFTDAGPPSPLSASAERGTRGEDQERAKDAPGERTKAPAGTHPRRKLESPQ
jgi:hypothetical protein